MSRRITVVGCGHVGLVTAAGLARLGHQVVGLDVDADLVTDLSRGVVSIIEPELTQLVRRGTLAGMLRFTTDYASAIGSAEFVYLCVDTPQTIAGAANLSSLRSAVRSIAGHLGSTCPIIVNKSTSPIGTGETIEELLSSSVTGRIRIVSNPEFLRQGHGVEDFLQPSRIVVGSADPVDAAEVAALYAGLGRVDVIVTDLRTAEMIKYVANAFLATRVSFINEVAALAEALGCDVDAIVNGVATDPRIGRYMFRPGVGYGGSCLPKDVAALRYAGEGAGVSTPILAAVQEVNAAARTRIVRRLRSGLGHLEGRRVAVWGMTFKANTEDVRESPAMDIIAMLLNEGADLAVFDPAAPSDRWITGSGPVELDALGACDRADALVVLTEWPQFASVEPGDVAQRMTGTLVVDGRNVLDPIAYRTAGLTYVGVGRPQREETA